MYVPKAPSLHITFGLFLSVFSYLLSKMTDSTFYRALYTSLVVTVCIVMCSHSASAKGKDEIADRCKTCTDMINNVKEVGSI